MTTESRAPQAADWADVVEALHGALTIITVRGQYPPGHPAIRRADEQAATGFARVFKRVPEIVVALIDNEFIVSERPRPELRERLPGLADVMTRHEIECFVFQQGMTTAECSSFAEILSAPPDPDEPARAREQAQARLQHVLLRFAELRSQDGSRGQSGVVEYLVPLVHEALADLARGIARGGPIDRRAIVSAAESIHAKCAVRAFALAPRAHAAGQSDLATHATNVATMTAAMADEARLPERLRVEVTAAALVHDIGRLLLPASIRDVPEPLLDEAARKEFRHHPLLGARALLAGGCPALWVAVALEHHRGVDGGGYPAFGSKAAPHALVRMVSLANYFDDKRATIGGKVDSPLDVLRGASALKKRYFDGATLELFVRTLGAFPPGTVVELTNRQAAVCTRANPGDPLRPEVSILLGLNAGKRVDLKSLNAGERKHELSIVRAMTPPLSLRSEVTTAAADDVATPAAPAMACLPDLSAMSRDVQFLTVPPRTTSAQSVPSVTPVQQPTLRPASPSAAPVATPDSSPPRARTASEPSLGPGRMVSAQRLAATVPISPVTPPPPAPSSPPGGPASRPSAPVSRPGAYASQPAMAASPRSARPKAAAPAAPVSMSPPRTPSTPSTPSRPSRPSTPPTLDPRSVPQVVLAMAEITKLPLDPRAGFLLSLMDGISNLETVVDASGLPEAEVLRIVGDLVRHGAVRVG